MTLLNDITKNLDNLYSKSTANQYRAEIRAYLIYLATKEWQEIRDICQDDSKSKTVDAFLSTVTAANGIPSSSTRNQYIIAIQHMYRFIGCAVDLSSLKAINKQSPNSSPPTFVNKQQAESVIFELTAPHNFTCGLLFYTALSLKEIYALPAEYKIVYEGHEVKWLTSMMHNWNMQQNCYSVLIPPNYYNLLSPRLNTVVNRLKLYEIGNITPTSFRLGGVRRLYDLGYNDVEIAKLYNISIRTVYRYKERIGYGNTST